MHSLRCGEWGAYDFSIGAESFDRGYFLVDGIYPEYSIFVKPFSHPVGIQTNYNKIQEAIRYGVFVLPKRVRS